MSYFTVTGSKATPEDLIERMTRQPPPGWHRDHEIEDDITDEPLFCFRCAATITHPAARVWLSLNNDRLSEANVLPVDGRRLTRPQWEAVIDAFVAEVLEPALEGTGLDLERSHPGALETYLTEGPRKRLSLFSRLANKSTGAAHPIDQARWFDFIIAAHRERSALPASVVEEWLIQSGWNEEEARDLAIQYEQQRALLAHYDPAPRIEGGT